MIDLDALKTDPKAESEGKPFTLRCGMKVTIARANTPNYRQKLAELMSPYFGLIRAKKPLPDGVYADITIKVIASAVILDWEPVSYGGDKFEYSPENAEKLLRDPKLHDIVEEISEISGSADAFREQMLVDAEKN